MHSPIDRRSPRRRWYATSPSPEYPFPRLSPRCSWFPDRATRLPESRPDPRAGPTAMRWRRIAACTPISRWLIRQFLRRCTNSMGSSIVRIWPFSRELMSSIMAASVVDLPEPVLPVTRIRPLLILHRSITAFGNLSSSAVLRLRGDGPEHGAHAIQLPHDVDAKSRDTRYGVGEIGAVLGLESFNRQPRHDLVQRGLHGLGGKRFRRQRSQRRRIA